MSVSRPRLTMQFQLSSIGLLIVLTSLCGCTAKIEPPTEYVLHGAPDKSFSIERPLGWDSDGGEGRSGTIWIKFSNAGATASIRSNLTSQLMADFAHVAGSMSGPQLPGEIPDDRQPEAQVHELLREDFEKKYNEFEHGDAETIRTKFGRIRREEFTARSGLYKIRGYRGTMVSGPNCYIFDFRCTENNWAALQPAYDRMLKSMQTYRKAR